MLYSRTPIPVAEKVFDDLDDNVARLGAIQSERLAKFLMRSCSFDRTQSATRDTYIHSGKTTCRVVFDSDWSSAPIREYYIEMQVPAPQPAPQVAPAQTAPGPQGQPDPTQQVPPSAPPPPPPPINIWVNDKGEQLEDPSGLQQDSQGFYVELDEEEEKLERVRVDILSVHTRDLLHNPDARSWEEIWWIAFGTNVSKTEFKRRFGEDVFTKCASAFQDHSDPQRHTGDDSVKTTPTLTARIWEIWNKEKREVYWFVENYEDGFVQPLNYDEPDPYGLDGFFPCAPFMLGTIGPDSLFPVPDFIQLRSMIEQIHGLAMRLRNLVLAAKVLGLYDDNADALKVLSSLSDVVPFIAVPNLASLVGDAGLDKLVWYFPIENIVQSIETTIQVMQTYSDKFNELFGIPDILRGVSDPNETAEAQQLKGRFISLRADAPCREFQRLVRDSIELMMDLALKKFPESKLAEIMGVSRLKPEDQAAWPQVLLLLQDDCERKVRIDIETDSTISMNQNAEIEQTNFLAKTILDGFAGIASATEQNKLFGPAAIEVLLLVVGKLQRGKSMEAILRQLQEQLTAAAQQPDAPDPKIAIEQFKAQSHAQIEQTKIGGQLQIAQQQASDHAQNTRLETQSNIAIEQNRAQADIAIEQTKAQAHVAMSEHKMSVDERMAQLELTVKALEAQLSMKVKEHTTEHDAALSKFQAEEQIKLENKKAENAYKAKPPGD